MKRIFSIMLLIVFALLIVLPVFAGNEVITPDKEKSLYVKVDEKTYYLYEPSNVESITYNGNTYVIIKNLDERWDKSIKIITTFSIILSVIIALLLAHILHNKK